MITTNFDDFMFNWSFQKGSIDGAEITHFDDSQWQQVDLPHDWAISGPFGDPTESGDTGKLPWKGEAWYRKTFHLAKEDRGKRLRLVFDGIMSSPIVYVNGVKVGSWIYGYNSFHLDVTQAVHFGTENCIAIHVDTREHGSRWYPGAGIYRKITPQLLDPVHFEEWGTFVSTPEISPEKATINVESSYANTNTTPIAGQLTVNILDPDGKEVATQSNKIQLEGSSKGSKNIELSITSPKRWDVDHPHLYTLHASIQIGGSLVDQKKITFGIRDFEWTVGDGFHLNGRRLQIKGVNLHHDHGPLGAAFYPRAMERQLQIMKDMGVNSIRTSHNPAAPEFYELCNEMGLVVFNELFDKYGPTSGIEIPHDEYVYTYAEREVENFVKRDRNHPCVCIWSIGNEIKEILEDWGGKSSELVSKMVEYFRKYDTRRPTSMGCHINAAQDASLHIFDALDSLGWNYAEKYVSCRKEYPNKAYIYTESASAFGTGGAYKTGFPRTKTDWDNNGEVNAHVLTSATWSDILEHEFRRMERDTYVAGEYVWTGFDYLGEPTPFNTPDLHPEGHQARSSYFGIVDLVGQPKDSFYCYRSHWNTQDKTVHLAPHWNWEGHEGKTLPVFAYSDGDEAELFVNGKSFGKRIKKQATESTAEESLTLWKQASASSEQILQDQLGNVQEENYASKPLDCNPLTKWRAKETTFPQHWEVDLGGESSPRSLIIDWGSEAKQVQFKIQTSTDSKEWTVIESNHDHYDTFTVCNFEPQQTKHVRVLINSMGNTSAATIHTFEAYEHASKVEDIKESSKSAYFNILNQYRFLWSEVPYKAGELKVVISKDGKLHGEKTIQTASKPSKLVLTPDRSVIDSDGFDLCYVSIHMEDEQGNFCPLTHETLHFEVQGNATFIGAGNGNQMGHDSFTASSHPLFYGRATVILRAKKGQNGNATLLVSTTSGFKSQTTIQLET